MKIKILFIFLVSFICFLFYRPLINYYKFSSLCYEDGGLIVNGKIKRGEGWLSDGFYTSVNDARLEGVGFSRFKGRDGFFYDVYYVEGDRFKTSSYSREKADLNVDVTYHTVVSEEAVDGWPGIGLYRVLFKKLSDASVVASYNNYHVDVFEEDSAFHGFFYLSYSCSGGYEGYYLELEEMFE